MAAWHCAGCDIHYPISTIQQLQHRCAKCGRRLNYLTGAPSDANWRDKLVPEQTPKEEYTPHPDSTSDILRVYNEDTGTIHITETHIRKMGYEIVIPGLVIRFLDKEGGFHYYELQGYDKISKMWWIEPFDFEETRKEIAEYPVFTGPSSDHIFHTKEGDYTVYYDGREEEPKEDG